VGRVRAVGDGSGEIGVSFAREEGRSKWKRRARIREMMLFAGMKYLRVAGRDGDSRGGAHGISVGVQDTSIDRGGAQGDSEG